MSNTPDDDGVVDAEFEPEQPAQPEQPAPDERLVKLVQPDVRPAPAKALYELPARVPITEWVKRAKEPPEWFVEGFLPARSLVMLAGDPKVGLKTNLALRMALSLARGEPFLGHKVKAKQNVVYCVPGDAEILTRQGWKTHAQLVAGEEVLALDHARGVSRWESLLGVSRFPFEGELRSVGPFHCTDDHRWPVVERRIKDKHGKWYGGRRKIIIAENFRRYYHGVPRLAPHEASESTALSPRLAAILGWVVTDGYQQAQPNSRPRMSVVQSSKKHLDDIELLLGTKRRATQYTNAPTLEVGSRGGRVVGRTKGGHRIYGDTYSVRVRSEDVAAIVAAGYRSKADLPSIVTRLSAEAAEAMFAAVAAEASETGAKRQSICFPQNDGPVLDAFQILCTLTGRAANITGNQKCRTAYVMRPGVESLMRPEGHDYPARSYNGTVWCPRTPSGTWFMRYRGKVIFTGNSFLEDGRYTGGWRARAMGVGDDEDLPNFYAADGEEGMLGMLDKIGRMKLVWVIDSLAEMEGIEGIESENDSIAITKLFKRYRAPCLKTGSTVLLIHHFRKDGDKMRGSGAMNAAVDGWIESRSLGQNLVRLESTYRNAITTPEGVELVVTGPEDAPRFTFVSRDLEDLPKSRGKNGGASRGVTSASLRKVLEVMSTVPGRWWTQGALEEAGAGNKRTVAKVLAKLVQSDQVAADSPKGPWQLNSAQAPGGGPETLG